jgi:hypothetical protein
MQSLRLLFVSLRPRDQVGAPVDGSVLKIREQCGRLLLQEQAALRGPGRAGNTPSGAG